MHTHMHYSFHTRTHTIIHGTSACSRYKFVPPQSMQRLLPSNEPEMHDNCGGHCALNAFFDFRQTQQKQRANRTQIIQINQSNSLKLKETLIQLKIIY